MYFKPYNRALQAQMKKILQLFLVVCFLFNLASGLSSLSHKYQEQTNASDFQRQEFETLTQQQSTLQNRLNGMLDDMLDVEKQITQAQQGSDKVVLLQSAILSERQRIFSLRSQIIPPFSLSRTACLQLTNQQKISLLDQIKSTHSQLTQLQSQLLTIPKCDITIALEKDIQKQLTLLDSLEKTILTECQYKALLTPTIYQTNIYADGWILGQQHIDDLIEEYYQRNIRYHNVTNCPMDKPFFDGDQCIICQYPDPVFNILTRQCTRCPEGQEPDSKLRKCAWQPHYTNFSAVQNWAQDGAPMPIPKRDLVPCPPETPYYNGKTCQQCLLPRYWSIKQNSCLQCPPQTIFDLNDKRCQKRLSYQLTILQGTRWVTLDCNLTRIVQDRIQVLNLNKTKKYYEYCPVGKPFFDGITCVDCPNQFNVDTGRCVQNQEEGYAYDDNMHCYVEKEYGKQTDPRADNYTSKYPLTDTITPNCKKARPYYDGIACIECQMPFYIFDVDTKRCTVCQATQYYDNQAHKCIPRPKIYISTNQNRLMATQFMSIDDYHEQIRQKINQNPDSIIMLCDSTKQYSNYEKCFPCQHDEYFNVQTKKCEFCDGSLDQKTHVCNYQEYLYTNLNDQSVKRIVAMQNTVGEENRTINQMLSIHKNAKICGEEAPYSNNKTCMNCSRQSFNYTSLSCVPIQCNDPAIPHYNEKTDTCQPCPQGTLYQQSDKQCQPIRYVTNTNALTFYIEQDNYTKLNLQDEIFELQDDYAVIPCDSAHPYFNGTDCIDCAINRNLDDIENHKPYFNLKSLQCQACNNYDKKTHRCLDKKEEIKCQYPTPVLNRMGQCVSCQNGTLWLAERGSCGLCEEGSVYNEQSNTCEKCQAEEVYNAQTKKCELWVSNLDAMGSNYIEEGNATLQNFRKTTQQLQNKPNAKTCPAQLPNRSADKLCVRCEQPTPYFNLLTRTCQACQNYDSDLKICPQGPEGIPVFTPGIEDFYGTIFG